MKHGHPLNVLEVASVVAVSLSLGCIDPPPSLSNASDMSNVEADAPADMSRLADMRSLPEDMQIEPLDMTRVDPCIVGTSECFGDGNERRVCVAGRTWQMRARCSDDERCVGEGECTPIVYDEPTIASLVVGPLGGPISRTSYPDFGVATGLVSDSFVVGAPAHQSDMQGKLASGAVFTFNRTRNAQNVPTWQRTSQELKLGAAQLEGLIGVPDQLGGCAEFGKSLAISQDGLLLAVGAPGLNLVEDVCKEETYTPPGEEAISYFVPTLRHGAVFLYTRPETGAQWQYQARLDLRSHVAEARTNGSSFGVSIAMSPLGDRLFVGAPHHDLAGASNAGAIFEYSIRRDVSPPNITPEGSIQVPTPTSNMELGGSISFAAERGVLAVGAQGSDERVGAVYLIDVSSAEREFVRVPLPTPLQGKQIAFGRHVQIDSTGSWLMSSIPGYCHDGSLTGKECDNSTYRGALVAYSLDTDLKVLGDQGSIWHADRSFDAPAEYGTAIGMNRDASWIAIGSPGAGDVISANPPISKGLVELTEHIDHHMAIKPSGVSSLPASGETSPTRARFGHRLSHITPGGLLLITSHFEGPEFDAKNQDRGRVYLYRVDVNAGK